jgi:hypothetical protein
MNSAGLAAMLAISGSNYMAVTLDPQSQFGAPEIVHVTNHGSSATTAVVVRGQEGTAIRAHDSGEFWVAAPTVNDYLTPNVTHLNLELFNYGGALIGSTPPVASGDFLMQCGSVVNLTNGGGDATLTFPSAFPNGVITVILAIGDANPNTNIKVILISPTVSVSGCSYNIRTTTTDSPVAGQNVRINWIAIGC